MKGLYHIPSMMESPFRSFAQHFFYKYSIFHKKYCGILTNKIICDNIFLGDIDDLLLF